MTVEDYNFELLPSEDADSGFMFGIGTEVSLDDAGFAPGSTDWATQDSENSQNGTTAFGRDRLLGPSWSWQLHVNREDAAGARDTLGRFKAAWNALHIRETPGAVLPLRYKMEGGPARRIYGRPRRFEAPPDNKIMGGFIPVSVDFKCHDGFTYADEVTGVTLNLGTEATPGSIDTGGGFVFPVVFPVAILPPTTQQTQLFIGGDAPARPVVRFNGPVVDPSLTTNDWDLQLNYTIPEGQYVEIDLRTWRMTALLNGVTSVAGFLGRRQRLSKIVFNPGRFQARYNGFSSGTSTCEIRWADTFNSY